MPGAYHPGGGKRPDVHETWKALSGRAGRVGPDDHTTPHHHPDFKISAPDFKMSAFDFKISAPDSRISAPDIGPWF